MGATLGCAECHDHKFDPYTTRDFYSFAAFFADVQETAVGQQKPISMPTDEQAAELRRLDERIAVLRRESQGAKPEAAVAAQKEIAGIEQHKQQIQKDAPQILVAMAGAPRTVRVLPRGNWLDETGAIVEPQTPGFLKPLGVNGRRANRLD